MSEEALRDASDALDEALDVDPDDAEWYLEQLQALELEAMGRGLSLSNILLLERLNYAKVVKMAYDSPPDGVDALFDIVIDAVERADRAGSEEWSP